MVDTTDTTSSTNSPSLASTTALPRSTTTASLSSNSPIAIIAAVVVVVLVLMILLVVVLLMLTMFFMKRRRKQESNRVQQLQNVVMETDKEQNDGQRYVDTVPNDYYSSVDKPPQNGVRLDVATGEVIITDTLYSNPDEVKNDTYSRLRDGEKRELTPVNSGASDDQYSKLNRSQTDPGVMNSRPSPTPQKPVDEGVVYAVPDKKKQSDNTPAVPEKSSELVEYLDIKKAQSQEPTMQDTPEYSEIESSTRSGSVGPVRLGTLTSTGSHEFLSSMSSNPLYHPTDIRPLHLKPISSLPPASSGVLEVNAIYAEPQAPPPSGHEPEWDPDQNIYESIYSEPLNPSLFMQNSEPTDNAEDLRPYMSIYTVPVVPTTDKPRSVSIANIKEIKHLGDGNFGQVVLAQTVGLTPKDLQLEGDASYTLAAVKKLKASASNRNRELFDKEVSFMSRLKHPNVIRLLGVCSEGETPFIMMEYMTNGDLNQYLQGFDSIGDETADSAKSISTSTLVYMCTQISSAMQYLASQNFVHRDLATRNCLVGSKDTIKISDFGMSRSLYESQYYVISGHAILPIRWMATECFFGKFSAKTDVWAFGVTMWEIFTLVKERPYDHLEDRAVVEDAVRGAKRTLLNRPAQCPENMFEIMRKCWTHDASLRPTFDELHNLLSKN